MTVILNGKRLKAFNLKSGMNKSANSFHSDSIYYSELAWTGIESEKNNKGGSNRKGRSQIIPICNDTILNIKDPKRSMR